jgi:uncharacterized damage-inducible protein DinB
MPIDPLVELRDVLLETWAANDAMHQLLLTHLNPKVWRAKAPAASARGGRTIAAIFSHLHNTRVAWLRNTAPHLESPALLNPTHSTIKQTSVALKKSSRQCLRMLTEALSFEPHRRVTKFVRDGYVKPWPAGATMFAYMFSHEAHHRGQIILLAHQLGYRLPVPAAYGIWHWEKLWKQQGFSKPR